MRKKENVDFKLFRKNRGIRLLIPLKIRLDTINEQTHTVKALNFKL